MLLSADFPPTSLVFLSQLFWLHSHPLFLFFLWRQPEVQSTAPFSSPLFFGCSLNDLIHSGSSDRTIYTLGSPNYVFSFSNIFLNSRFLSLASQEILGALQETTRHSPPLLSSSVSCSHRDPLSLPWLFLPCLTSNLTVNCGQLYIKKTIQNTTSYFPFHIPLVQVTFTSPLES